MTQAKTRRFVENHWSRYRTNQKSLLGSKFRELAQWILGMPCALCVVRGQENVGSSNPSILPKRQTNHTASILLKMLNEKVIASESNKIFSCSLIPPKLTTHKIYTRNIHIILNVKLGHQVKHGKPQGDFLSEIISINCLGKSIIPMTTHSLRKQ